MCGVGCVLELCQIPTIGNIYIDVTILCQLDMHCETKFQQIKLSRNFT